jgi:hypothetical protein
MRGQAGIRLARRFPLRLPPAMPAERCPLVPLGRQPGQQIAVVESIGKAQAAEFTSSRLGFRSAAHDPVHDESGHTESPARSRA